MAVGFDFRVVSVEPFGHPRLACGFDLFGKVFAAGNVSKRWCMTSFMSKPVNEDHQYKDESNFILKLC